jgi:mannose-6-phosphate isomerase-like protein (cupin superfamily)
MNMLRKCAICLCITFVFALSFSVVPLYAQDSDVPHGFAFNDPGNFKEYPHFHGGAGTIRYNEYWGADGYKSAQEFIRLIELPPKSSIGEYRLTDSDEVIVVMSGHADVTVNGNTGRLVEGTMVPVKMGESLGIYNSTDEVVKVAWTASVLNKGQYNTVDLGNDLTGNRPEDMIPFKHIYYNYLIFEPSGNPSHDGLGSLVSTLGIVNFDYFKTGLHTRFFVVPAGASIGYHTHVTNEENFFIFSGSGRATVNDVTLPLKPLDCIKCGIDETHGIYNNTDEQLVMFFTNQPMPGVKNWGTVKNHGENLAGR